MEIDIRVENHGSIYVLYFETDAAREWRNASLPADAQTWGKDGVVVEPRYVGPSCTEPGLTG